MAPSSFYVEALELAGLRVTFDPYGFDFGAARKGLVAGVRPHS